MNNNQKSKFKHCLKYFKKLDLFGAPIQLRIKDDTNYKSILGGFCGICYLFITIFYILLSLYDFAWRNNTTGLYLNQIINPVPELNLSDLKYTFALGLVYRDNNMLIEKELSDFFVYEFNYIAWDGYVNATQKVESIKLRNCLLEDLNIGRYSIAKNQFDMMQLGNYLCPEAGQMADLTLKGLFVDEFYHFYELSVSIKPEKIKYLSELEDKLDNRPIKAYLTFLDTNFDFENYATPLGGYMNSFSAYIKINEHRELRMKMALLEFNSDNNIIVTQDYFTYGLYFDGKLDDSYMIYDRENSTNPQRLKLLSIYKECSTRKIAIERTYQKLPDCIANMTGLTSQLVILLYAYMGFINGKAAQQKIMHSIMKFSGKKNYNRELFLSIFEEKVKLSKDILHEQETGLNRVRFNNTNRTKLYNANQNNNMCNNKDLSVDIPSINRPNLKSKICLIESFNQSNRSFTPLAKGELKIHKTRIDDNEMNSGVNSNKNKIDYKQMHMSSLEICLSSIFCCVRKWKVGNKIIEKGDEKVNFYLDILTYIKKLNEVDILKHLLLSPDQLVLFSFLSSPTIATSDKSEVYQVFAHEQAKTVLDKKTISKLSKSYERVLNKEKFSDLDGKIIKMFNSEVEALKDL